MNKNLRPLSKKGMMVLIVVLLNAIILRNAFMGNDKWYWGLLLSVPLFIAVVIDFKSRKHSIKRNDPLIKHPGYRSYFRKGRHRDKADLHYAVDK